jgi:hypothetical protein
MAVTPRDPATRAQYHLLSQPRMTRSFSQRPHQCRPSIVPPTSPHSSSRPSQARVPSPLPYIDLTRQTANLPPHVPLRVLLSVCSTLPCTISPSRCPCPACLVLCMLYHVPITVTFLLDFIRKDRTNYLIDIETESHMGEIPTSRFMGTGTQAWRVA